MRLHVWTLNREGEHAWHITATSGGDRWHGIVAKGWWSGPWKFHRHRAEVEVALGGEDNMLQLRVSVPFVGHVAAGLRVPRRWTKAWIYERRVWSIQGPDGISSWAEVRFAYDDALDNMGDYYRRARERGATLRWSRAATWAGWSWRLRPRLKDRLLGRTVYTGERGSPVGIVVPMPEGEYRGTATRVAETWRRPRSLRVRREVAWDIDVPAGIPVPGKGENSWDCDDDAIYSIHMRGERTRSDAIAEFQSNVLRTRARYASPAWVPRAGWRAS